MGMVIFSGSALTPLGSKFVQILSFTIWYKGTRATGLNVCSGMVGCQHWLILVVAPPWAETAEDIAVNRLEGDVLREWVPAQGMEGGLTASVYLNSLKFGLMVVWSLTILLVLLLLGLCICSMFLGLVGFVVGGVHLDLLPCDAELGVERCSSYSSLPGPLQTVQRAEMWR